MWTEENDATTTVAGAYSQLREAFAFTNDFWGDLRSNLYKSGAVNDATYNRTGLNQLELNWSGSNWSDLYKVINSANLILKHIDDIQFRQSDKKNEALAQAYFLRAYCYYYIVRLWGDAPLVLSGYESENQEDMYPFRSPAAEIYAQVESDIESALTHIPSGSRNMHQASPAAINMLRADYYLWKGSRLNGGSDAYTKALASVNAVLNAGYSLVPDFADIFINENNSEYILSFPYTVGENVTAGTSPNYYAYMLGQTEHIQQLEANGYSLDYVIVGSHAQYEIPNDEYMDFLLADPDDSRGAASVRRYEDPFLNNQLRLDRVVTKFIGSWDNKTRIFDTDVPVYRLAEAYLLKAEAENALGNIDAAITALNVIAKRARGIDNFYTNLDRNGVINAIINETKMEFVAEGKTWWVYLRNNKEFEQISSLVGRENELNVTLWPVAQACITTNPNITQTEGYK